MLGSDQRPYDAVLVFSNDIERDATTADARAAVCSLLVQSLLAERERAGSNQTVTPGTDTGDATVSSEYTAVAAAGNDNVFPSTIPSRVREETRAVDELVIDDGGFGGGAAVEAFTPAVTKPDKNKELRTSVVMQPATSATAGLASVVVQPATSTAGLDSAAGVAAAAAAAAAADDNSMGFRDVVLSSSSQVALSSSTLAPAGSR